MGCGHGSRAHADFRRLFISSPPQLLGFSKGHWENPEQAHGDKRDPEALARWRKLAEIGKQTDRHFLNDQADIAESFKGLGDLEDVPADGPVL